MKHCGSASMDVMSSRVVSPGSGPWIEFSFKMSRRRICDRLLGHLSIIGKIQGDGQRSRNFRLSLLGFYQNWILPNVLVPHKCLLLTCRHGRTSVPARTGLKTFSSASGQSEGDNSLILTLRYSLQYQALVCYSFACVTVRIQYTQNCEARTEDI